MTLSKRGQERSLGQVVDQTHSNCVQSAEKTRHLPSRTFPRPPGRHHASSTIVNPGSPFPPHSCLCLSCCFRSFWSCLNPSHRGHVVRSIEEVRREERDVRQLCLVQPHAQRRVSDEEHAGGNKALGGLGAWGRVL